LHLFAGLFMLPWVVLYGVTSFLFNHPTAFSDQPTATFGKKTLQGTPLELPPVPAELAAQVVAALRERTQPNRRYSLVEPEQAKFTREFAFATVKGESEEVSVLIEVNGNGGTVRSRTLPPAPKIAEPAPFEMAGRKKAGEGKSGSTSSSELLKLDNPLHERVKAAIPAILERTGFPTGSITVTSVPDVSFLMEADGKRWRVTYNPQTGALTGRPPEENVAEPVSPRRFFTRLHQSHGYPSEMNSRWTWALAVDAMAFIMVFWAASGLIMWWQVRSTRWLGLLTLAVSAAAATWMGLGMHEAISAAGR
jgi:hypothetical protein